MWSVSRQNLMAADVARRGLTRFGEVPVLYCIVRYCIAFCGQFTLFYIHSYSCYLIPCHPMPSHPMIHYPTLISPKLQYTILPHLISFHLISSHLISSHSLLSVGRSESEQHRPVYRGNGGQICVRTGVRWKVRTHTHTHTHTYTHIHMHINMNVHD